MFDDLNLYKAYYKYGSKKESILSTGTRKMQNNRKNKTNEPKFN